MTTAVIDFETRSLADLKRSGAPRYAADPTTEILCLDWRIDDGIIEAWHPGEPPEATSLWHAIRAGATLVAHKASFEKSIWRAKMVPEFGWPPVPNSQWHDTLAMCAMRGIPQGLDRATRVLGLKQLKDNSGSKFTVALSKLNKQGYMTALTPEIIERVDLYCADDVHAQAGLHERLGWLPEGERDVWLLDQRINERGFRIDVPLVKAMKSVVDQATGPLAQEFHDLTDLKFTQLEKFKAWCAGQGFPMQSITAESMAEVLGYSPDMAEDDYLVEPVALPDSVRRALSIRQLIGSAAVKKLAAARMCVMDDGRVRDSLQYHGAGPGRWAGRLLQPHNFPRGTIKAPPEALVAALMTKDPDYVQALFGPPVETVVSSLRHIIVAGPARVLVAGDFAGIEARITLALAGAREKVALMASGADVYCDMASQIYKRPITKADTAERQVGKNSVLGLGFQMGAAKFFLKYGKGQTLEFCEEVVRTYRKEWAPEVPDLWYGLRRAATDAVHERRAHDAYGVRYQVKDKWLTARLPSGRELWYFNPQAIAEAMPWDPNDIRPGFTYQAMKGGKWITVKAFGGLLTENVAQGLARDLLCDAMFKCEKAGLPVVLTVHDEIVCEPRVNGADEKVLDSIMQDRPRWAVELGIPVAARVLDRREIQEMKIIAFDLGSTYAWAHNAHPTGNVWHVTATGARPEKLATFAGDVRSLAHFDLYIYERPFTRGQAATRMLWGMAGILEAAAHTAEAAVLCCSPGEIKKWATGDGHASKEKMLVAATAMGYGGSNEHEADAYCLLKYAEATCVSEPAPGVDGVREPHAPGTYA